MAQICREKQQNGIDRMHIGAAIQTGVRCRGNQLST
jgi:hypothetical protein